MKLEKKHIIMDAILVAVLLAVALAFCLNGGENGSTVEVYADAKLVAAYPLDKNRSFTVETEYGKNRIIIENGAVFVAEADCPAKSCVKSGKITRIGQCISCLPNKITVRVCGKTIIDGVTG